MDNPYQASTAPLVPAIDDQPADKSMVIGSAKGPITLAARRDSITVEFNGMTTEIATRKFVTSVVLLFWKTKRMAVKPVKLSTELSEGKFLEVLEFYGIQRFKENDIKTARILNGCTGFFLSATGLINLGNINTWSLPSFAVFTVGIASLSLFLLSFSRLYLSYYALTALVNLFFSAILCLFFYRNGGWWIPIILFFTVMAFWNNLQKFLYFRKHH